MTIDLDPYDDPNGHVNVLSIRVSGNVATVDLAFKLEDDSGPWQIIPNMDATKAIIVPVKSR